MEKIKCVIVGDGAVGKTCFLIRYTKQAFPEEFFPTVFDNYSTTVFYKGRTYELALWDTAGQADYDRLRPMSYPDTDVFIITFSIVSPWSLYNVKKKWFPEVSDFGKHVPIILLGLKVDLRKDETQLRRLAKMKESPSTMQDGLQMAQRIGAVKYFEASSLTKFGVNEVFEEVIEIALSKEKGTESTASFSLGKYFSAMKQNFVNWQAKEQKEDSSINLPEEIENMDNVSIDLYVNALRHGIEKIYDIRLMIVGPFAVGKTALTQRLLKKRGKLGKRKITDGIEIHEQKCGIDIHTGKWILDPGIAAEKTPLIRIAKLMTEKHDTVDDSSIALTKLKMKNVKESSDDFEEKIISETEDETTDVIKKVEDREEIVPHPARVSNDDLQEEESPKTVVEFIIDGLLNEICGDHSKEEDEKNKSDLNETSMNLESLSKRDDVSLNGKLKDDIKQGSTSEGNTDQSQSIQKELKMDDDESSTDDSKDDISIEDTMPVDDVKGKQNLDIDKTRRAQILASIRKTMTKLKSPKNSYQKEIGKISIWDFGGQFVFYSTHQIFLSARAIYIIVVDISKELTEEVMDECFLDSSGVKYSTLQERLLFWLNSIHTYGNQNEEGLPPVFLVATHRDKLKGNKELKQEKVKLYFDKIRKFLADKKVNVHLIGEDFAVSNAKQDKRLKLLKQKIYEVASKQKYWGEAIPARWIALENLLMQRKTQGHKIISFNDVVDFNKCSDMPIKDEKELQLFLQFEHDLGNIIFFKDENLRQFVVLQPQWLVDAFRCIITAEEFCTKNIQMRREWDEFYEEGILKESLIDFVWQIEANHKFYENKTHILGLMEKIDIIAKPLKILNVDREHDQIYLSPCLLRKSFPADDLMLLTKEAACSPVLCYVFTDKFVPPAVFHRLLAACIGNWQILQRREKLMIFCGCGMFSTRDQCGRFLIKQNDHVIQLQAYYFGEKSNLETGICVEIREFITSRLNTIIENFHRNMPYSVCIKCSDSSSDLFEGLIEVNQLLQFQKLTCDSHGDKASHAVVSAELLKTWFADVLKSRKEMNTKVNAICIDHPEALLYRNIMYSGLKFRSETLLGGDSFFLAISDQLDRLQMPHKDHLELRKDIVNYLQNLDEDEKNNIKGQVDGDFDLYLENMRKTGMNADDIVVQSMAKYLGRQMIVVTTMPDGDDYEILEKVINEGAKDAGESILLGQVDDKLYQSLDINKKYDESTLLAIHLKKKIKKNYKYIVKETDLKLLLDGFFSEGIFSIADKEMVELPSTTEQRNRTFLDLLMKKPNSGFKLFLDELATIDRTDVIETIQKTKVSEIFHETCTYVPQKMDIKL